MTLPDMTSGGGNGTGTAGNDFSKFNYPGIYTQDVSAIIYSDGSRSADPM